MQSNQNLEGNLQNSKKVKIAIFAVCLIGTLLFVGQTTNNKNVQMPQLRLLQATSSNSQVISSERNMTVCGGVFSSNKTVSQYSCSTYLTEQDMVARQNLDETLSVYVVYKSISQFSEIDTNGDLPNEDVKMIPIKKDDLNLILKATVSQEGQMVALEKPAGTTPSDLLVRLTERLIEQYFPNLNATLYNVQDSEGSLLRSSEQPEGQNLNVEDSYLGKVSPTYTIAEKEDGTIEMHKSYTQNNFVNYEEQADTKIPEVVYDSKFIVQDGAVKENKEILVFSLNQKDETISLTSSQDEQTNELIGSINARIESNFRLISTGVNKTLTTFIKNYEKNTQFSQIDLSVPETKLARAPQKNLLSSSEVLFTKDYKIFEMKILDNNFSLAISMTTQEEQTNINSGVFLNNQNILSIYNSNIEHKFIKCEDIAKSNENQSQDFNVFKMTHKIFGGIVSIPVSVDLGLKYGWQFTQQQDASKNCQVKFVPYAEPKIKGTAKVSFLSIGEAGIEAHGTVANTYVTFEANINKVKFEAHLNVDVKVLPYTYQVQLFYNTVKCSPLGFFSKLIGLDSLIDDSCQTGEKTYIDLSKGQSAEIKKFNLINQQLSLSSFYSSIFKDISNQTPTTNNDVTNNSNTTDSNSSTTDNNNYDYSQDNNSDYDNNNSDYNNNYDYDSNYPYYDDQNGPYSGDYN